MQISMAGFNQPDLEGASLSSGAYYIDPPDEGGDVTVRGKQGMIVRYRTNSAASCYLPAEGKSHIGQRIGVTNVGTGTITVKRHSDDATVGTVIDGLLLFFILSGNSTWTTEDPTDNADDVVYDDDSGKTTATTVNGALDEIYADLTAIGRAGAGLGEVTFQDGTPLAKQAGTTPGYAQLGGPSYASRPVLAIVIPASGTPLAFAANIDLPSDISTTVPPQVKFVLGRPSDFDTMTLDLEAYPIRAGGWIGPAVDIYSGAAQPISNSTDQVISFTLDNVTTDIRSLCLIFTFSGLMSDQLYIHAIYMDYTKRLNPS